MRFLSANAFQLFFHYTLLFPNITNSWGPHTEWNRQQHSQVAYSSLFSVSYLEEDYSSTSLCFMLFSVIFNSYCHFLCPFFLSLCSVNSCAILL